MVHGQREVSLVHRGPEWKQVLREMDFRVGGRERVKGAFSAGRTSFFDALYVDIVPQERFMYMYDMYVNETRISISLATIEFKRSGPGTCLRFTEQAAFLDGLDYVAGREQGTRQIMEQLSASLQDWGVSPPDGP